MLSREPPALILNALRERLADVQRAVADLEQRLSEARRRLVDQDERVARVESKLRRLESEADQYAAIDVLRFANAAAETRLRRAEAALETARLEAVMSRARGEEAWLSGLLQVIGALAAPPDLPGTAPAAAAALPEEERQALARRLHDGPVQALASIALRATVAGQLVERQPAEAAREIARVREEAERAATAARQVLADLHPMALDDLGIVAAVRALATASVPTRPPVAIEVRGRERRLPPLEERALYWATREVLALASAGGSTPTLLIEYSERGVAIEITQEWPVGPGTPDWTGDRGARLRQVQERLEAQGGTLQVQAAPGGRLVARLELPARSREGC